MSDRYHNKFYGKLQRISTGISELDDALEGGVPKGSWVAITGEPGTGKSILCMHYAYAGLKNNDPVIYVTTEAEFRDVVRQARQFNMDFEEYEIHYLGGEPPVHKPWLVVIDIFSLLKTAKQLTADAAELERKRRFAALDIETLIAAINEAYAVLGVTDERRKSPIRHVRLIIDSLSAFWADKPAMARKYSYQLKIATHRENVTAYLVSQYAMTTKSLDYEERVLVYLTERGSPKVLSVRELISEVSSRGIGAIKIPTFNLEEHVIEWHNLGGIIIHEAPKELFKVVTESGKEITLTNDHCIYFIPKSCSTGSIVLGRADDLSPGDKLLAVDHLPSLNTQGGRVRVERVRSVRVVHPTGRYVYDLVVPPNENFFAGTLPILVHNSTFGFGLEHIADGVIHLWMDNVEEVKEVRRYLIIKKMRMTNHYISAFKVSIVPGKGIVLDKLKQ
ncbi:MAG: hypothetical protein J7L12_01860 [Desulfurococcales archaeon]|nr:hypothetical protein [Desulfurococcales archaeon]